MEENMGQALNDIETFHLEPPPLFANIDNGGSNNDVAPLSGLEVADTASDIPTSMSMDAAPEIKNFGAKTKTEKVSENPEMPQTVGEVLASLSWNDASEGNGEGGSELNKDNASSHNIADSTDTSSAGSASVKTSMDNANGTFANTVSDLTSVDDVSMTSMDTVNNLTSMDTASDLTSIDDANKTSIDIAASDLTSVDHANIMPSLDSANKMVSEDHANKMVTGFKDHANKMVSGSEDHANKMVSGSEDHANKMVSGSEDHANKMVSGSEDHANEMVSDDHAKKTLSEDHISKMVAEDHANKVVSGSKDHANKIVSEDHAKKTVSEDHAKKTVSEDHAKKTVSEDHAKKTVSEDHASKVVSEDHANQLVSEDHANNAMSFASDSNISSSCDNSILDCDKNITSLDSAKGSTLVEDGKESSSGTQKNSSISEIAPSKDNVSASSSAVSDVTQSVSGMIMPMEGISSEDSSRTETEPNISTVQLVPASLSVTQKEQETKASSSDHTNQPTSQTPGSMKVKHTTADRCQTEETSPKLLTIVLERCKVSPDGTMKITSEMESIRNVRQPKTLKGKSGKAGRPRKDSSLGLSNAVHQKGEVSLKKVGSPQKDSGVKKAGRPKKSLDTTVEVVGTDKKDLSAKAKNDDADQSEVQKNDNDSSGKHGVKRKYVRKSEASERVSPKRKYVRKEQTPVADSPKRKYVRKNQTSVAHLLKRKYVRKNQTAVPDSPKRKYVRKNLTPIASSPKRKYVRKDQTATANLTKRKYVRKDQALEVQTPKRKYVRKAQTEEDKPKRKYIRKAQTTEEDKPKRKYVRKAQTTEEDKPKRKYVRKDQTSVAQMLKRKYKRKEMNPSNAGMTSIPKRGVLTQGKRKFTLKHSLRSFNKRSMRSQNSMSSSVSSQEKADSVGNTTVIPHGKKKVKLERKPPPESPPLDPTLPVVEVDRDGEPVDDLSIFEHDKTVSGQPNKSSFSRGRRKRGRRKQVIQPTEESTSDPPLTVITPKPFMKTGCDKNHECCRKNAVLRQDESTQWEDPSEWFAAIDRSLSLYLGMNYGHVVFSQSTPEMPGQSMPQSVIIQRHPVMTGAHENTSVLSGIQPMTGAHENTSVLSGIQSGNLVRKISAGTPPTATIDYSKVAHPKHLVHNQAVRHLSPTITMMPVASQEIHRPTLPANTSVSMASVGRHNLKFPDHSGKIWNVSLASDNADSNDTFGVSQVPGNVPSASGHPQNIPPAQRTVTVYMHRNSSLVPQDIPSQNNVAPVQQTVPLQRNTSSHKPAISPDNIHKTCPQTFSPWKSASTVQQSVPSQSNVAPNTKTFSAQDQKPDSAVRQVLMSKISADVVSRNTRNTSQDQASEQIGSVSSDDSVILIDD